MRYFLLACFITASTSVFSHAAELPAQAKSYNFQTDIRAVLETKCLSCHGSREQEGSFRLDSREHFYKGGDSGPSFTAGQSAESDLIQRIARTDPDYAMPPEDELALTADEVAKFRLWIDRGAPWPEGFILQPPSITPLTKEQLAELPAALDRPIDFVADIKPLLHEKCEHCHGGHTQENGFRIDHKASFFKGGDIGPAVVPGNVASSLLIQFVAGFRTEGRMPKKGAPLTDAEIAILRTWIEQGADYPDSASVELVDNTDHWAFKRPVKAELPTVPSGTTHPIDAFVEARLVQEGLAPAQPADWATLLRRVHLDLIGLPPSLEVQEAFLKNPAPESFAKVVDDLLSSVHYGERWGRHWLDAARYADSDGYEKDKPRIAHFYRDWVIQAINNDMPYDQFIIHQLAGDLLPDAQQSEIVATGYLRNSMLNEEGGVDPEQFRMEAMFDRMDAVGKGILGLGLNCAQCHTHKYDPITQKEYYQIFAFLNNDHEAQPRVYTPAEMMQKAAVHEQIAAQEEQLRLQIPDWKERVQAWENEWRAAAKPEWDIFQPVVNKNKTGGQRYLPQDDGSIMAAGFQPTKSTTFLEWDNAVDGIQAIRIEMLNDPNLPATGPGRSHMGTFGLSEFQIDLVKDDGKTEKINIVRAVADLAAPEKTPVDPAFNEKKPVERYFGPASYAIDGDNNTGWSSDLGPGRRNHPSVIVFVPEKPLPAGLYHIQLLQRIGGWNADDLHAAQMGKFRFSLTTEPFEQEQIVPVRVQQVLTIPAEQRTEANWQQLFSYWRTLIDSADPSIQELCQSFNNEIEQLWAAHPEGTTQFTLQARETPRPTMVLKRGDWLKPGEAVEPTVLEVLHPLPENADSSRLTLARWLVDERSPTTARVIVNRVWQAYFGTGLIATPEDLGTQGEFPSHPELLDWLAVDFMQHGWSFKHLHRVITSSRTYQQSSEITAELYEQDPQNRLLARGPRFRVEGEVIRDLQLAISGLLCTKVGGRAVMPPAPQFLFEPPASYAPFPWKTEEGEDRYRRSVYTWRRRTTPYPFLTTFDAPVGNIACVQRTRANTPLQALMTLNETVSIEAMRAFALRIVEQGGTDTSARLDYAYRVALARTPTADEKELLTKLYLEHVARFESEQESARLIAFGSDESTAVELPEETNLAELAAWCQVARVILNLDETITKE